MSGDEEHFNTREEKVGVKADNRRPWGETGGRGRDKGAESQ